MVAGSSCGGGATVSAGQYVKAVCSATTGWQQDIQKRTLALADSLDPQAGVPEQKRALAALLDGLIAATDRFVARVKAAGTPDIDGGEDAANQLNDALARIDQTFRTAREQADQVPTDSKESFQHAANKIGESVNSSVAGIQDPFRDQGQQLDALAAKDPACQQTQG